MASEGEFDSLLPSFEELPGGVGEAQEPRDAAPSVGDGRGSVDSAVGADPDDGNDAPTPRMELDKLGKTDGHRNVDLRSDVSVSEEQGGAAGFPQHSIDFVYEVFLGLKKLLMMTHFAPRDIFAEVSFLHFASQANGNSGQVTHADLSVAAMVTRHVACFGRD